VKLYPVRATRNRTRTIVTSEMIRAWEAALKFKKTQVILYAYGSRFKKADSLIEKHLLEKSVKKGVFVVTAASNSNDFDGRENVLLPCGLANGIHGVVCVAATLAEAPTVLCSNASKLASFGSPGSRAIAPTPNKVAGEWIYEEVSGSSDAAAAVAGVVALMKSFEHFKPDAIERMLLNATEGRVRTKTGYEMTYGVLRPDLAVKQAIAEAGLPQITSSKWGRLIRPLRHWRGSREQSPMGSVIAEARLASSQPEASSLQPSYRVSGASSTTRGFVDLFMDCFGNLLAPSGILHYPSGLSARLCFTLSFPS
ncbi:hypothetical protein FOZ62_008856, partial [Perkinsus olseni]